MAQPPTALFVSAHLDDVAFSCAGTVAGLGRLGWRVTVATVFTRSVLNPTGFALACQLDKGLTADVDYMDLRRREDTCWGDRLKVESLIWLDLPEAPHRGYMSAADLFAGILPDDTIAPEIARRLSPLVETLQPAWIFGPQSIGNHTDHRQVARALIGAGWPVPIAWYRDLPYASKFPDAQPSPDLPSDLSEVAFPLGPADLAAKVAGASCYTTQVPFQFGAIEAIARVLGSYADREAARVGASGPVETFLVPDCPIQASFGADWVSGAISRAVR